MDPSPLRSAANLSGTGVYNHSAPSGPDFPALQYGKCGLSAEYINVYPFRGMPDISIHESIYVNTEGNEDDPDSSFEDCTFENTRKVCSLAEVPPKFGQLFATLHYILYSAL